MRICAVERAEECRLISKRRFLSQVKILNNRQNYILALQHCRMRSYICLHLIRTGRTICSIAEKARLRRIRFTHDHGGYGGILVVHDQANQKRQQHTSQTAEANHSLALPDYLPNTLERLFFAEAKRRSLKVLGLVVLGHIAGKCSFW